MIHSEFQLERGYFCFDHIDYVTFDKILNLHRYLVEMHFLKFGQICNTCTIIKFLLTDSITCMYYVLMNRINGLRLNLIEADQNPENHVIVLDINRPLGSLTTTKSQPDNFYIETTSKNEFES